jgi:two-component system response regulator LytT
MRILIIEDELKTARALTQLIAAIEPAADMLAPIQSVEDAVAFLREHAAPDLIFMDVQLADGQCFEIFKAVIVNSPVIFCTAFDDYMMDAFKANGVDYILKPFSRESISAALTKVRQLKNFFHSRSNGADAIELLLAGLGQRGKKGFLVFKNNKYLTVPTEKIAFFYIRNEMTIITTLEEKEFPITQSLEEVCRQVDGRDFFRLNRQYLIGFKAIKEVEHYFARKLQIHLNINSPEKLLVGKDKTTLFLNWLSNR